MHLLLLSKELVIQVSVVHPHDCFVGCIVACDEKSQSFSGPSHSD